MSDPIDIGAARFKKANDSEKVTPRDALVAALAEIDAGRLNPRHIIIGYTLPRSEGVGQGATGFFQGGDAEWLEQIGMLTRLQHFFLETD